MTGDCVGNQFCDDPVIGFRALCEVLHDRRAGSGMIDAFRTAVEPGGEFGRVFSKIMQKGREVCRFGNGQRLSKCRAEVGGLDQMLRELLPIPPALVIGGVCVIHLVNNTGRRLIGEQNSRTAHVGGHDQRRADFLRQNASYRAYPSSS